MRCQGPELCLALADKRADGVRGGSSALAGNGSDGVPHQLARKVGHAKQIVLNWQRKILFGPIKGRCDMVSHCMRGQAVRHSA